MRFTFVSRSSLLKPSPLLKWVRTSSPSNTSTARPRRRKSSASRVANVDLPAPDKPVSQSTNPSSIVAAPCAATSNDVASVMPILLHASFSRARVNVCASKKNRSERKTIWGKTVLNNERPRRLSNRQSGPAVEAAPRDEAAVLSQSADVGDGPAQMLPSFFRHPVQVFIADEAEHLPGIHRPDVRAAVGFRDDDVARQKQADLRLRRHRFVGQMGIARAQDDVAAANVFADALFQRPGHVDLRQHAETFPLQRLPHSGHRVVKGE